MTSKCFSWTCRVFLFQRACQLSVCSKASSISQVGQTAKKNDELVEHKPKKTTSGQLNAFKLCTYGHKGVLTDIKLILGLPVW